MALLCSTAVFAQKSKKDTVTVIRKNTTSQRAAIPQAEMRKKVRVIRPGDTIKKPEIKEIGEIRPIDTVIIVKEGKTPEEIQKEQARLAKATIRRDPAFCECVEVDVQVADTLKKPNYLTYTFVVKNNCKIDVWLSTKHFRFIPHDYFGHRVKVIRKLGFVVRHDYPDFVKLSKGEERSFRFSDDAFYEFDIARGNFYKFQFVHNNTRERYKNDPRKTFLCIKKKEAMIYVR